MFLLKLNVNDTKFFVLQCETEIVIDVVHTGIEINEGKIFFGLYNVTVPQRCWVSGNRLLLSTNQKNEIKTYVVDIGSAI